MVRNIMILPTIDRELIEPTVGTVSFVDQFYLMLQHHARRLLLKERDGLFSQIKLNAVSVVIHLMDVVY